ASTSVAVVAILHDKPLMAFLMLALAGAAGGFLLYNFYPAKIYMGDTGSLFLGFTFAGIATIENMKTLAMTTILIPVIALAIPLFDMVFAIIRRSGRRRSISARDTDHFFHKLMRLGMGHRKTVLISYALTGVLGLATIVFIYSDRSIKQAILIVLALLFGVFLYTLEYLEPTGSSGPEDE
ncbi:MAG: undecaprenyl/decaprenyl-phosphate alpha-N-acetylglucosaminyl 1-phosphate transferase, partial [bacterium]|nr:undecaprenyl/decaprenyl-phosphate alpha-N-acetylglucosaminyl 1-phosphate transferase [bacterium]